MAVDYYGEARNISSALLDLNFKKEGNELNDAIKFGSTSTEILLALRYHLTKLVNNIKLPEELEKNSTDLIRAINQALS